MENEIELFNQLCVFLIDPIFLSSNPSPQIYKNFITKIDTLKISFDQLSISKRAKVVSRHTDLLNESKNPCTNNVGGQRQLNYSGSIGLVTPLFYAVVRGLPNHVIHFLVKDCGADCEQKCVWDWRAAAAWVEEEEEESLSSPLNITIPFGPTLLASGAPPPLAFNHADSLDDFTNLPPPPPPSTSIPNHPSQVTSSGAASPQLVTPLWAAAVLGRVGALKILAESGSADVNTTSETGSTAVRSACFLSRLRSVSYMVSRMAANPSTPNHVGGTPLINSVQCPDLCRFLINHATANKNVQELNSEYSFVNGMDVQGKTALHYAAQEGYTQTIRLLLDAGALPTLKNRFGNDVWETCAIYGSAQALETLIDWANQPKRQQRVIHPNSRFAAPTQQRLPTSSPLNSPPRPLMGRRKSMEKRVATSGTLVSGRDVPLNETAFLSSHSDSNKLDQNNSPLPCTSSVVSSYESRSSSDVSPQHCNSTLSHVVECSQHLPPRPLISYQMDESEINYEDNIKKALYLMGTTMVEDYDDIPKALNYWSRALELWGQAGTSSYPLKAKLHCLTFLGTYEFSNGRELDIVGSSVDIVVPYLQSIIVTERILGPDHEITLSRLLRCGFKLVTLGAHVSTSFNLWSYAVEAWLAACLDAGRAGCRITSVFDEQGINMIGTIADAVLELECKYRRGGIVQTRIPLHLLLRLIHILIQHVLTPMLYSLVTVRPVHFKHQNHFTTSLKSVIRLMYAAHLLCPQRDDFPAELISCMEALIYFHRSMPSSSDITCFSYNRSGRLPPTGDTILHHLVEFCSPTYWRGDRFTALHRRCLPRPIKFLEIFLQHAGARSLVNIPSCMDLYPIHQLLPSVLPYTLDQYFISDTKAILTLLILHGAHLDCLHPENGAPLYIRMSDIFGIHFDVIKIFTLKCLAARALDKFYKDVVKTNGPRDDGKNRLLAPHLHHLPNEILNMLQIHLNIPNNTHPL